MKKVLFFLSFCFFSLYIQAEEKKVITDADIFNANVGNPEVTPILHAWRIKLFDTAFDPYVSVANAREKAKKNTKCTITATSSEITIRYVTAAMQDCDFYKDSNKSNYGSPKRPDMTECKHGHHHVTARMILEDGSEYTGSADYDCSYSGYQVFRKSGGRARGRNAVGQIVNTYISQNDADPYAPWYVEHTITQYINLASFANSAKISTNELVKRILYYGIRSFIVEDDDFGDGGIRNALFIGTGYKAKWNAFVKMESSTGLADWNAAKSEMKKIKPDFEKASRLFISGSKHLNNARKYDYAKVEEVNTLFRNFTNPMFNMEAYDTLYMGQIVQVYENTMKKLETPDYEQYVQLSKETGSLIAKLWYNKRDYNPVFFETYNQLYSMPDDKDKTIRNSLKLHRELFCKSIKTEATTNPVGVKQTIANYMNNPLKGDNSIDSLINAKIIAESVLAKENLENGEFDILHMFRNEPSSAMWDKSRELHNGFIMSDLFEKNYTTINNIILLDFRTLCNMIINNEADKVRDICHNHLDSIFGAYNGEYVDRSDLFDYYYNLYDYVALCAHQIEKAAENNNKKDAEEIINRLHKVKGQPVKRDYKLGHVINRNEQTAKEKSEIRRLLANVRKQVYLCKKAANFDEENDFLIVVETGNETFKNLEFGVGIKDAFTPINEVYIDGKFVKIKPKKYQKKWQPKQWLYKYKGSLQTVDNNSFHCFIFKGKDGISGLGKEPFLFDKEQVPSIYWLEYPSSASKTSDKLSDKIQKQNYLNLIIH